MKVESTQPGIFHIHVDGSNASSQIRNCLSSIGFVNMPFYGHPEGYRHFEPALHMTLKTSDKAEFADKWEYLHALLREQTPITPAIGCGEHDVTFPDTSSFLYAKSAIGFTGYIEGEYVKSDEVLGEHYSYTGLPVPFRITRRRLLGHGHCEPFRQTELHLVIDKDESDPRLIKGLLDAGLYGAYVRKTDHTPLVLTAQGFVKDIEPLIEALRRYVNEAGGAVGCTLKEERALRFGLVGVMPEDLPEIVDRVEYFW